MDNELFDTVLDKSKTYLREKLIVVSSEKTIIKALPLVIECVEMIKDKGITGDEKKNLVLKVLLFIVNQSDVNEGKKTVLRELIEDGTIESTIQIIVDASKGQLQLNRKTKRRIVLIIYKLFSKCTSSTTTE